VAAKYKKLSEKHPDIVSRDTCVAVYKKRIQTTEQGPYRGTKRHPPDRADSLGSRGDKPRLGVSKGAVVGPFGLAQQRTCS